MVITPDYKYGKVCVKIKIKEDKLQCSGCSSWDLVKEVQKEYLQKHYPSPDIEGVKHIAIDEFAVKKGHKYMTVVLDLDTGIIIFVGDGKEAEALEPFWKRI